MNTSKISNSRVRHNIHESIYVQITRMAFFLFGAPIVIALHVITGTCIAIVGVARAIKILFSLKK